MSTGISSLKVEIGFGGDTLSTPTWTNVTADVKSVDIVRGRTSAQDMFPPGTCQLVLDNTDFVYDPDNPSGPGVAPLLPVQVSVNDSTSTQQFLFSGFVNVRSGWTYDYSQFPSATVTVNCSDFLAILASFKLAPVIANNLPWSAANLALITSLGKLGVVTTVTAPTITLPGLTSSGLLIDLDAASTIPTPAPGWIIDNYGKVLVQGYLGAGQPALQWLQSLALTEGGEIYVYRTGEAVFDGRHAVITQTRMSQTSIEFTDNLTAHPTGVQYSIYNYTRDFASSYLYNSATVTPDNGVGSPQTYSDATAIATYTEQDYTQGGIYNTDADALAQAYWVVTHNETPLSAPASMVLNPRLSNKVLNTAVQRELRDRAIVYFKAPGATSSHSHDVFIERIEHHIDASLNWTCVFGFATADGPGYFATGAYALYDNGYQYDAGYSYAW